MLMTIVFDLVYDCTLIVEPRSRFSIGHQLWIQSLSGLTYQSVTTFNRPGNVGTPDSFPEATKQPLHNNTLCQDKPHGGIE